MGVPARRGPRCPRAGAVSPGQHSLNLTATADRGDRRTRGVRGSPRLHHAASSRRCLRGIPGRGDPGCPRAARTAVGGALREARDVTVEPQRGVVAGGRDHPYDRSTRLPEAPGAGTETPARQSRSTTMATGQRTFHENDRGRSRPISRRRTLDRDRGAGAEQVRLAPDRDLQRGAFVKEVVLLVVGEPHPDLPVAESQREC
jgi:hypothetical protein